MIGTLLDCQIIMNLLLSEIPFRIIAIEIEGSQAWGTIAERNQCQFLFCAWHCLRHDAIGAIGELFDTPKLGIFTRKLRFGNDIMLSGCGKSNQ